MNATSFALVALTSLSSWAHVAGGSTAAGLSVADTTQIAVGSNVKKTLLGKPVYNEAGAKLGQVEDLIISPDKLASYVIVGAAGFVGVGRHDVAIPVLQLQNQAGKLVLPGATKASIKAMPGFHYAVDTSTREQVVATADADIAKAKTKLTKLDRQSSTAAANVKVRLAVQTIALKREVSEAETHLAELKTAAESKWRSWEAGVSAATARLRQSMS